MGLPRVRFTVRRLMVVVTTLAVCFGWIAFLQNLPAGPEGGDGPLYVDRLTGAMVWLGVGAAALAWYEFRLGPRS